MPKPRSRRAALLAKLPPDRVAELFPPYPSRSSGHRRRVRRLGDGLRPALRRPGRRGQSADAGQPTVSPSLDALDRRRAAAAWVRTTGSSPERTTTGGPLLANDMHLGIQMPSIWYEIGLHCQPAGPECRLHVVGFSFAGLPAVIVGHNDRIAWGVTNVGPDVQDLYIEKINPDNPDQYEVNGAMGRHGRAPGGHPGGRRRPR